MSHYSEVQIEFMDKMALIAALERMGFQGKVEVHHEEAQPLYGWENDVRSQKAHIIIRRVHVGFNSNDIGFERQADGKYRLWVSKFDQEEHGYDKAWQGRLKQAYGVEKARVEAKKKGYLVHEQKLDDGHIRLVCRK